MQKFLIFSAIGMEIGFLIFVASWLGARLDQTYHTDGMIFVALSLVMLVGWLVQVIWLVNRLQKQDETMDQK